TRGGGAGDGARGAKGSKRPYGRKGRSRASTGLDTRLTENAQNLSGGQRQRLALARALLHDSPVYIF
ncbi:MAG TPA: hypothetical protein DCF49_07515, partial [Lachnospiraceae bacterium]|nr:hypothetical protein [Lachnospiraceae bacterium]